MNVFISSTYIDCIEYRKAVIDTIESLSKHNLKLIGMELFGSRKETTLEVCMNEVKKADIYILIVAHRYGSIDGETNKSYTQLEYEEALKLNIPILIYFLDESVPVLPKFIDRDSNYKKLEDFKSTLSKNHTYSNFFNENDLRHKVLYDLCRELNYDYKLDMNINLDDIDLTPDIYNYREYEIEFIIDVSFFDEIRIFKVNLDVIENLNLHYGNVLQTCVLIKKCGNFNTEINLLCQNQFAQWLKDICDSKEYIENKKENELTIYKAKVRYRSCMYRDWDYDVPIPSCILKEFSGFELISKPKKNGSYRMEDNPFDSE